MFAALPGLPGGGSKDELLAGRRQDLLEVLVHRHAAAVLVPQPVRELGEALVDPDVAPVPAGDRVAVPLVRELVRERQLVRRAREQRAGRGLERVADVRRVVDDRAGLPERVRAVTRAEEVDDLRQIRAAPAAIARSCGSMKIRYGTPRAVRAVVDRELADRRGDEIVRDRRGQVVVPDRARRRVRFGRKNCPLPATV